MNTSTESEFAAHVGIDWADRKHDVCLQAAGSSQREFSVLAHRPESIAQWAEGLRRRFGTGLIAVCLEIGKGPLVYALQRHAFLVLFVVNPATLAKYRETFCVSGAKDDPSDAQLALELLLTHRERLVRLNPERGPVRVLQQLVEQRRALVDDVRRLTNRITDALKQYFRPARCGKYYDGKLSRREILLILEVRVGRYKYGETFLLSRVEQLSVFELGPAPLVGGCYLMLRQQPP